MRNLPVQGGRVHLSSVCSDASDSQVRGHQEPYLSQRDPQVSDDYRTRVHSVDTAKKRAPNGHRLRSNNTGAYCAIS